MKIVVTVFAVLVLATGCATAPEATYRAGAPSAVRARPVAAAQPCDPAASSLRPSGPPTVTAGSFAAKIHARGYLIVGVDQSGYHFAYRNQLTGVLEGFDIDMARAVAAAIFGDPNKIEYKVVSVDQRIAAVNSGAVDMISNTMTITCQRLEQVDFSTVYYDAGQRVLVPINSPVHSIGDLGPTKKVCAAAGSTSIDNIRALPSHPIVAAPEFSTDCLALLQEGQVDAVSTDDSILAGMAAQDPDVHLVGPRISDEPYGLAIAPPHPDFVRFVNAVLAQIRSNGYWAASYRRWIANPAPAPPTARYRD